jgi:hypothetical protein
MTTIWERTYSALTSLSIPMAASAYIPASAQELPDSYLVYFVVSDPPILHADDKEKLSLYRVQVSYYSRSGMQAAPDISGAMITAGFMRADKRDLPYNPDSRHFGIAMDFSYLEEQP